MLHQIQLRLRFAKVAIMLRVMIAASDLIQPSKESAKPTRLLQLFTRWRFLARSMCELAQASGLALASRCESGCVLDNKPITDPKPSLTDPKGYELQVDVTLRRSDLVPPPTNQSTNWQQGRTDTARRWSGAPR